MILIVYRFSAIGFFIMRTLPLLSYCMNENNKIFVPGVIFSRQLPAFILQFFIEFLKIIRKVLLSEVKFLKDISPVIIFCRVMEV